MQLPHLIRTQKKASLFIVFIAVIGLITVFISKAATFGVGVEPEQCQIGNNTQIINNDSTASGGSYVKFGNILQGQNILYTSNSCMPTAQIWRMKADGTGATRLTNDPDHEIHWARPSPDGSKILFYKQDKGTGVNSPKTNVLWVMNADGSNQHRILAPGQHGWKHFGHGEWSPDSTKIVQLVGLNFTNQIAIINDDGSNPTQVTNKIQIEGQDASAIDPSWPNDNTIIFIRQWNCLFVCGNQDIYKLNLQTGAETRLTNDTDLNFDPYLSPDGKTYVWLRFNCLWCQADLYKADASVIPLVPQPLIADGGINTNGTFSPDGQYFVFAKREFNQQTYIYRIKLDGSDLTRISKANDGSGEQVPGYY